MSKPEFFEALDVAVNAISGRPEKLNNLKQKALQQPRGGMETDDQRMYRQVRRIVERNNFETGQNTAT